MKVLPLTTPAGDRITTDATLADDLRRSLQVRGVPVGRTWGEFMAAVELAGLRPGDPIDFIDYGTGINGTGRIVIDRDDEWAIGIREVR